MLHTKFEPTHCRHNLLDCEICGWRDGISLELWLLTRSAPQPPEISKAINDRFWELFPDQVYGVSLADIIRLLQRASMELFSKDDRDLAEQIWMKLERKR